VVAAAGYEAKIWCSQRDKWNDGQEELSNIILSPALIVIKKFQVIKIHKIFQEYEDLIEPLSLGELIWTLP
jgi:nucleotidyltransferase/DNA polymerase involved in DNA repair